MARPTPPSVRLDSPARQPPTEPAPPLARRPRWFRRRGRRSSAARMVRMPHVPASFPPRLQAVGTGDAPFRAMLSIDDLPDGSLRRVSHGELDILLAHTD